MPSIQINHSISGAGLEGFSSQKTRTGENIDVYGSPLVIAPGKAGTLTTRTSDTAGEATLASGHGITTGAKVGIYWATGRRYDVTVGTVAGDVVPFSGGSGDDLPAETTAVVVCVERNVASDVDGDKLKVLCVRAIRQQVNSTAKAHIAFYDDTDTEVVSFDLPANDLIQVDASVSNPLASDVADYSQVSNGSASEPFTLNMFALKDA